MTASATSPTTSVGTLSSPRPRDHDANSCHAFSPSDDGPGELRQLADDDVDRGAGQEPGHDRAREEPREPAQSEDGDQQEQRPGHERDRGDAAAAASLAGTPGHETAPPATAASDELGPVEMCRDVQKQPVDDRAGGRRVEPVLASGTPAMPA